MSNSKIVINRIPLSETVTREIAKKLDSEESPLIAITTDEFGNINFYSSGNLNKPPFDLNDHRFKRIFSENFIISEGSNSVAVNIAGASTTSSFPV